MPVDPSIILQANSQGPDLGRVYTLAAAMQQMQVQRQKIAAQNTLKSIFSNPANFDTGGTLTPDAQRQVMATDPAMGMKMQSQKLQDDVYKTDLFGKKLGMVDSAWGKAQEAYDQAKKSGATEEASRDAGQRELDTGLGEIDKGGVFSEQERDHLVRKYDPLARGRLAANYQAWKDNNQTQALAERKTEADEKRANAAEKRADAYDALMLGGAGGNGSPILSGDALDYAAEKYRKTGTLPPVGYGAVGTQNRNAIIKRAAELAKDQSGKTGAAGADEDVSTAATTKADSHSLMNLTKMTDAAVSFEQTASKNFDLAMKLAPKAVPTDWGPWLNRWIMEGETMMGDKNVPPYITAMLTGANEYAKIMSGSTGAQGSTVDSRREAATLFSPYLAKGQISEVIKVAKKDMQNRKDALHGQIEGIKGRIRAPGDKPKGKPPTITTSEEYDKLPDGTDYIGPDGKPYTKGGRK